ncbi:hypothetical protein AX17_003676 [Amanita inopinata Kibby_2008]|nr:hypothetical protein AX17_003676 [Amanita inopinata Kibby_2008]
MTLPTPPRSLHSSNKENDCKVSMTTRGVVWAPYNQIHNLSSPPAKSLPTPTSGPRNRPTRSILKKQSSISLALPQDICDDYKPRDVTPEPADPLVNLEYLAYPVSRIIATDALIKDMIEAYNILAVRLRSCVAGTTDADASWPLFQPIRKNKDALAKAIIRDLGKALVDPVVGDDSLQMYEETKEENIVALLPSPKNTPKKKRDGMTAEQVKYARDLCNISHAVIKLLGVVFSLPAVYGLFSNEELSEILTQVLAIPLTPELPTINARKTCALAICLIQSQRLPRDVLAPAADKITAALRRAIDGELGKEGKKGSVSDGLRAIHDLCAYQPAIFVKAFVPILPFILQNLLGPTLPLRVQACQALGGIVTGANKAFNRKGHVHARLARFVRYFLTRVPAKKKEQTHATGSLTATTGPSTPREPTIIRTLRLTLEATQPQHSAQGPVWALNVLANFIALLGPVLIEDQKLCRTLSLLLALGLRHPKSSVRALACVVWRPLVWVWFQPTYNYDILWEDALDAIEYDTTLSEEDKEAKTRERKQIREKEIAAGRASLWKMLTSVVECQTGISTIAALLGVDHTQDGTQIDSDETVHRVFSLLKLMITKGGQNCSDAIEVVRRLISFEQVAEPWHMNMLLPRSLFSATSNLLTIEFKSLSIAVRSIIERSAGIPEVRSLTREELSRTWIFEELIEVWKAAVDCLVMYEGDEAPADISEVWDGLIKANVGYLQDANDDNATIAFAVRAAEILVDVIQDQDIDLTPKSAAPPAAVSSASEIEVLGVTFSSDPPQGDQEPTKRFSNGALKLRIVRDFWATVRTVTPHALLAPASEKLLVCLVKSEAELLAGGDVLDFDRGSDDAALKLWAQLSAELVMCCEDEIFKYFWSCDPQDEMELSGWTRSNSRLSVWSTFASHWKAEDAGTWENSVILLSAPFLDASDGFTSDDDRTTWTSLLDSAMDKALDHGFDNSPVLNDVAASLIQIQDWIAPCRPSIVHATDALLSRLDLDEIRELPMTLLQLVDNVLRSTYPPLPSVTQYARWLLRTVAQLLDRCVMREFAVGLVTAVRQSVSVWIQDETEVYNEEEWSYDIEPLYGYLLSALRHFPKTIETLNDYGSILESALLGNTFRTSLAAEAFKVFWTQYSSIPEPKKGWSKSITRCLFASGLAAGSVGVVAEQRSVWCTAEAELAGTPRQSSMTLSPISSPVSSEEIEDVSGDVVLHSSVPKRGIERSTLVTPTPPPSSLFSSPPNARRTTPTLPASLVLRSPSSPTRTALKNATTGSRKRRRISFNEEKENDPSVSKSLPFQNLFSLVNLGSSLAARMAVSPSKRKLEDSPECVGDNASPSKKSRFEALFSDSTNNSPSAIDTEDERDVATSLLATPRSSDRTFASGSGSGSGSGKRKRSRMVMEFVEVPSVTSVKRDYQSGLRRTQSLDLVAKWKDYWISPLLANADATLTVMMVMMTNCLERRRCRV